MGGCFANLDLLPEPDIEDAMDSLAIIRDSKARLRLYASSLFATITRMALDFKKDLPANIRKALVLEEEGVE